MGTELPRDRQVIVTCCHKQRAGPGVVGLVVRAGVSEVRLPLWQELCSGEGPGAIGARCLRAVPCGAIPGRAAMGTKPRYGEINSWTFWPGFCRTNFSKA